jgi:hypothetical protein
VNSSESLSSVAPPIAFTPFTFGARPFERGRANGCSKTFVSDGFVCFSGKLLYLLQRNFCRSITSDHPLWFIEELEGGYLIGESIIFYEFHEWFETIVNIRLTFGSSSHHIATFGVLNTFKTPESNVELQII